MIVTPTGAAIGAVVDGVELNDLEDRVFNAVREAWLRYQVLLFRDQRLDDAALIAFSRRFGELDWAPVQEDGRRFVPGLPEIYVVSNVIENGVAIGSLGAGEAVWHTDMSYVDDPPVASLLYALEVPRRGGDTSFCSMYAVWEALPAGLREEVRGLRCKHDGTFNSGGYVRAGVRATDDPRESPGAVHPLVCRHPETEREVLYLGRRRNAYLVGLALDRSEALLDRLWSSVSDPAHCWTHKWRAGDLVLWDNRCTMHRRDGFDASERRVMHRTQVKEVGRSAKLAV
jgi:taurine dioxygenase